MAILRKGEYIGDVMPPRTLTQQLTEMMVGQKVELNIERPEAGRRPPAGDPGSDRPQRRGSQCLDNVSP